MTITYVYRSLDNPILDKVSFQKYNRKTRQANQCVICFLTGHWNAVDGECDSMEITSLSIYLYVLDRVKVISPSSMR